MNPHFSPQLFPCFFNLQPLIFHNDSTFTHFSPIVFVLCFSVASVLPIRDIAHWAHGVGAKVLVDACQSVPHMVVDVQNLDADFLVASSHKVELFIYF